MEHKMVTIPFDLETAKRIREGKISGRIVTEKGRNRAEIVYEDNLSNCPLLVVIHSISVSADWFSATGKALSSENRLLLEVPEYITFKDGEVLSNEDGDYIFILNTNGKYLTSIYASFSIKRGLTISDTIAANGTLHVMMHGDTNYNPTPEFTQYGGSNIENSVTIIDGILNDGGDW